MTSFIAKFVWLVFVFTHTHHYEPQKAQIVFQREDGKIEVQTKDCHIENCLVFKNGTATSTITSITIDAKLVKNKEVVTKR